MAVGLTQDHMLLITENFYVFEVDRDHMQTSINNLYLNAKPLSLSKKYPELSKNDHFNRIRYEISHAFIDVDSDGSWLCFITSFSARENGINYNLEKSTISEGWKFNFVHKEVLISTKKPCNFYSIRRYNGQFQIGTFECSDSTIAQSRSINQRKSYRSVCFSDHSNDKIFFNPEESDCKIPVHWPILKGFVASEKFFLFGKDYIYVFDENVYHQSSPEKSYPIKSQSYDSFFTCPGKNSPPLFNFYTMVMIGIIIIGLIILILLLRIGKNKRRFDNRTIRSTDSGRTSFFQMVTKVITGSNAVSSSSSSNNSSQMKSRKSQKTNTLKTKTRIPSSRKKTIVNL